jgi:hypothetical protein
MKKISLSIIIILSLVDFIFGQQNAKYYEGKIDKYEIGLTLNSNMNNNELSGEYFYKNIGSPLILNGVFVIATT